MGLADVVATSTPSGPIQGLPCSVGILEERLTGDDLDALLLILYGDERQPPGRGLPASQVFRLVTEAGHAVGYQTINRHRGGTCRCSR